jgi:hypothetical protein
VFNPETIQARLREKPFKPLRIIVSEGQHFDIQHPDLVLVGRDDLIIGFATPDMPTIYNRVTRVALIHVVAMEDLPAPASTGNGEASGSASS